MIRSATISDRHVLTDIALKSKGYWNYSSELLQSWRSDLTVTSNMIVTMNVFKFVVNSKIVGFYILNKPKEDSVVLEFLFIHPDFIGQKIGKQLLFHAFEFARKLYCTKMSVLSDPNALEFYQHFGFVIVGSKESSVKNRSLPILEKAL